MLARALLVMILCSQSELLASGVRVLIKRVPIERVIQKLTLPDFPKRALKPADGLEGSRAAFVDELLQASCQSCFKEIFDEKNFRHYFILEEPDANTYIEAHRVSLRDTHSDAPYEVTVLLSDEATLADSLLEKFGVTDLDDYHVYYREIDDVLADLRALLDKHGREYHPNILASAENLAKYLRQLAEARDELLQRTESVVTEAVTPRMQRLLKEAEELSNKYGHPPKRLSEMSEEERRDNLRAG